MSRYAVWRRSKDVVFLALLLRLFIEAFDTIHACAGGAGMAGASSAIVMLIIDTVALWAVWRTE